MKSNGFAFNTNVPGALIVPSGPCERPVNIRIASIYGDSVHLIPCHLLRGSFTKTLFPHFIRTDIAQDQVMPMCYLLIIGHSSSWKVIFDRHEVAREEQTRQRDEMSEEEARPDWASIR